MLRFVLGMCACQTGERTERQRENRREREGVRRPGVGEKNIRLCLRGYSLNVGSGRARGTAGPANLHPRSLSQRSSTASRITHSKNTAAPLPRPRTAEHLRAPSPPTVGTLGPARAGLEQVRPLCDHECCGAKTGLLDGVILTCPFMN